MPQNTLVNSYVFGFLAGFFAMQLLGAAFLASSLAPTQMFTGLALVIYSAISLAIWGLFTGIVFCVLAQIPGRAKLGGTIAGIFAVVGTPLMATDLLAPVTPYPNIVIFPVLGVIGLIPAWRHGNRTAH